MRGGEPTLAIVIPVHNEAGNVAPLVAEIEAALALEPNVEIVVVDDGSTDATAAELARIASPRLRVLRHRRRSGQSAAILSGVRGARAALVVTLDGDGQNDPADIPRLLAAWRRPDAPRNLAMIAGQRAKRRDSAVRRLSSRIANGVRSRVLGDGIRDTGCGLKAFRRDAFLALPAFDHMHRFLPALMLREGHAVETVAVGHRPRRSGRTKYGIGNRLWVGLVDLAGVAWLRSRRVSPELIEPTPEPAGAQAGAPPVEEAARRMEFQT